MIDKKMAWVSIFPASNVKLSKKPNIQSTDIYDLLNIHVCYTLKVEGT